MGIREKVSVDWVEKVSGGLSDVLSPIRDDGARHLILSRQSMLLQVR
jgi:hypothetical protein